MMDDRDRDKVSRNKEPAEGDDMDRKDSADADFGQNPGRADLWDSESSRRQSGRLGDGRSDVGRTGPTNRSEH
jgi:hypothetical protein